MNKAYLISILLIVLSLTSPIYYVGISALPRSTLQNDSEFAQPAPEPMKYQLPSTFKEQLVSSQKEVNAYPYDKDFLKYLGSNPNEYKKIWEPWLTKAAVHAIAVSDDYKFFAVGGGYLYDNEIHVYRWNYETNEYDRVWDSGDEIIKGDVISLAIEDTDNNNFVEVIAGSADGHIYVFEQRHIYDPITHTESMFDLVWTSEFLGPVFKVVVEDLDKDLLPNIIAGTWEEGIVMYEYDNHSHYPFEPSHWIEYNKVWTSGSEIDDKIYSLATGDFNDNGLPDMIVGTRNGKIYIYENNGTVIDIEGTPFPLTQDNSYRLLWSNSFAAYAPILSISVGDLDGDDYDEAAIVAATQSVYILNYASGIFSLSKLYYPIYSWEMGTGGLADFPVDYYADMVVEANNVTYFNGSYVFEEPIPRDQMPTKIGFNNTAMAGPPDGEYSRFNSTINQSAIAVIDFGIQEEAVGDGSNSYDLKITFIKATGFASYPNFTNLEFYVSYDGIIYEKVEHVTYTSTSTKFWVYLDIDPALNEHKWRFARYLKIVVSGGQNYAIDAIETYYIDKQLTDIVSSYIGKLQLDYGNPRTYLILGSITGKIIVYHYNATEHKYEIFYDAYQSDNFAVGTHIWYLTKLMPDRKYPYWIFNNEFAMDIPSGYYPFNWVFEDLDGDGRRDLIVSTKGSTGTNEILFLQNTTSGDYVYQSTLSNYIFQNINDKTSSYFIIDFAEVYEAGYGRELIISYKVLSFSQWVPKFYALYLPNPFNKQYSFEYAINLIDQDLSGKIYSILANAYPFVTFDFGDIDNDGDMDAVIANGKLYLFECVGYDGGEPQYVVNEDYFSTINDDKARYNIIDPQFVDFNQDGILDIIFSYENRKGSTLYENIRTADDPKWVEKPTMFSNSAYDPNPITNFGFNNYSRSIIVSDDTGYTLFAQNTYNGKLSRFLGITDNIDTLAIATYPLVMKINIGPITKTSTYKNFGYHIIETWSTIKDLSEWTLSLDHGDIDGDGKGEVIIGDFDNNAYVFEHLINNTYKRAYRTRDLYYEYETTLSPYASEELSGVSEKFVRRVWEHARFVIADIDMDSDGYKEFAVITKFSIYIFEHKGYENYELEWHASLLNHTWASYFFNYTDGITAAAYGPDIDYDGYGEIFLGIKSFLLVYELTASGELVETFNQEGSTATYLTPGSPMSMLYTFIGEVDDYSKIDIQAITVNDIDMNGYYDVILGGINYYGVCDGYVDGFLYILENNMGTYYLKWEAPQVLTRNNEIYEVQVDDQDYDGRKELIIGHENGIDVWEYNPTGSPMFERKEIISGNPNYPERENIEVAKYWERDSGFETKYVDMVQLPNGSLFMIVASTKTSTQYSSLDLALYYSISNDNGSTWSTFAEFTKSGEYETYDDYIEEQYPTLLVNGSTLYVVWILYARNGTTYYHNVYYKTYSTATNTWAGPTRIITSKYEIKDTRLWHFWRYYSSTHYDDIGLSYYNASDKHIWVYVHTWAYISWPFPMWIAYWAPYTTIDLNSTITNYEIISHDISKAGLGKYVLAFTGYFVNETNMYEVWVSRAANASLIFDLPTKITMSAYTENRVSLAFYEEKGVLALLYTSWRGVYPYNFYIAYSTTYGYSWSTSYELNNIYPALNYTCVSGVRRLTFKDPSIGDIYDYRSYGLGAFFGTNGYLYFPFIVKISYSTQTQKVTKYGLSFGMINNTEWAFYDLGGVYRIDIGDTDRDAKREIVANYFSKGVTVFEITSSDDTHMYYNQTWILDGFDNQVTDISVGDSNNNGWPEIGVSTERGDVFLFEFKFQGYGQENFGVYSHLYSYDTGIGSITAFTYGLADIDGDSRSEYWFIDSLSNLHTYDFDTSTRQDKFFAIDISRVLTQDVNNDSAEDIIISFDSGLILFLNGRTLDQLFNNTESTSRIVDMVLVSGILYTIDQNGYLTAIYANNGTTKWKKKVDNLTPKAVFASEYGIVGVQLNNETIAGFNASTADFMWNIDATYFNFRDYPTLALEEKPYVPIYNGSHILIVNMYTGNPDYAIDPIPGISIKGIYSGNFDNKSYDDILIAGNGGFYAISGEELSYLFVRRIKGLLSEKISVADATGDGLPDILILVSTQEYLVYDNNGLSLFYDYINSTRVYPVIDTRSGDVKVYSLLNNGTIVLTKKVEYMNTISVKAYYTFKNLARKKFFDSVSQGQMLSADLDADGLDELYVHNATVLYQISLRDFDITDKIIFGSGKEVILLDLILDNTKPKYLVIVREDNTIMILDWKLNEVFVKDMGDTIRFVYTEDFDGDYVEDVAVITSSDIFVFRADGTLLWKKTMTVWAAFAGNFDSYKDMKDLLVTFTNNTMKALRGKDGVLLWTGTIDIGGVYFMNLLDIDRDDYDDLITSNVSGHVRVYKGGNGLLSYKFDLPYRSYIYTIENDYMLKKTSTSFIAMVRGVGHIVADVDGSVYLTIPDDSLLTGRYSVIDVDRDGYYEYFTTTYSNLRGITEKGTTYMVKTQNGAKILSFTFANKEDYGNRMIAILDSEGNIYLYTLETLIAIPENISTKNQTILNTNYSIVLLQFIAATIVAEAILIGYMIITYLKKKRKIVK